MSERKDGFSGRFGLVLSYGEDPTTTGNDGGGIALMFKGEGRYWVSESFGFFLNGGYDYQRIGLSGTGNRTPFVGDPALNDATVFNGQFRVGTGVLLAI